MFARFNHLGLHMGIEATKTSIDRIRHSYDKEVLSWKTNASDYLLLPSLTSTVTFPYEDDTAQSMSLDESPTMSPKLLIQKDLQAEHFSTLRTSLL